MFQKYLASQTKLSTMVNKQKQKTFCEKKVLKVLNPKKLYKTVQEDYNPTKKLSKPSNHGSGSEYFPSTASGKKKKLVVKAYCEI